jgi:hypothetical protein
MRGNHVHIFKSYNTHSPDEPEIVVSSLLDDEQKKTWSEMIGEPFEVRY